MKPMLAGSITARLTEIATAPVGMPQTPATGMLIAAPAPTAGPLRVSMIRHGVTRVRCVAALGVFAVTVTVAVALFALPQELLTCTQYDVVADGETVTLGPVAPWIGEPVPDVPVYH